MDRVNDDSSLKFCSAFNPPLFCNNDELFEKIDPAHLPNFSLDQTIRLIIKNIINVTLLMANSMRFKNRWECLVGRHCDDNYLFWKKKHFSLSYFHIFLSKWSIVVQRTCLITRKKCCHCLGMMIKVFLDSQFWQVKKFCLNKWYIEKYLPFV